MTCDKEPYNTSQLALSALKGLIKRGLKKLKAYKCKECGSYHLSSLKEKPIGYMPQTGGRVIKKKTNKKFKPIKVTQQEIEAGRKYKAPAAGIFYKINQQQNGTQTNL